VGDRCFAFYKTRPLVEQYQRFWASIAQRPRRVLEVGIWDGGSTAFWFEYFQPRKHVAVDLLERGDVRAAATEAEKAKALAPRSPAVREVLGMALYGQERFGAALSELQTYRRMSGRDDQNHLIGDCLRAIGRPERVLPLVEAALRARIPNESKAEAAIVGASAMADLGRYEEALALLRRARTHEDVGRPYVLRMWYVTGDILERAGRSREAAEQFRKVVRHDAGAFDAAERLAALA
jgi:tetratricopeptide (TPR) repeat protein